MIGEGHQFTSALLKFEQKYDIEEGEDGEITRCGSPLDNAPIPVNGEGFSSPKKGLTPKQIRVYLSDFSNVVTMTWITRLIEEEISLRKSSKGKTVFLINLVPNRINLFKKCLFLNQTPAFYHVSFDYFAIHLIRSDSHRKDVSDSINQNQVSLYDDVNAMFVQYFRSTRKLINVVVRVENTGVLKIKLTANPMDSNAIRLCSRSQLKNLISAGKDFTANPIPLKEKKEYKGNSIFFVVGNTVDLETENTTLLLDSSLLTKENMKVVKIFVSLFREVYRQLESEQRKASRDKVTMERAASQENKSVATPAASEMTLQVPSSTMN